MKLSEAIEVIEAQAAMHPAAASAPKEPHTYKRKEWCKTISTLDKSYSDGYSLVGDFIDKKKELEPGLFLIFTLFAGQRILQELAPKWVNGKKLLDEDKNIIFHEVDRLCPFEERRGLLFDFDGTRATLQYFTWLPPRRWAIELWKPIETWLELQPNIETKIEFWEAEVKLRSDALHQAQQRLEALKQRIATDDEELDPQTKEWLQTAAVLGNKKGNSTAEATLTKTFY